jgi:hypothetical protein
MENISTNRGRKKVKVVNGLLEGSKEERREQRERRERDKIGEVLLKVRY